MKRLRKVSLNLDRREWPNEYGYAFYLRSRSLCHFIERSLGRIDIRAVAATKLCITGRLREIEGYAVNSSHIACLEVLFSASEYDRLKSEEEINAFAVQFLRSGLAALPPGDAGDLGPLLEVIQQFENEGYINKWEYKSRRFRAQGFKACLHCMLTTSSFNLILETISRAGEVRRQKLLRTDPDELAFHHRFKDILLEGDCLVISSRIEKPLCRIPLADLLK